MCPLISTAGSGIPCPVHCRCICPLSPFLCSYSSCSLCHTALGPLSSLLQSCSCLVAGYILEGQIACSLCFLTPYFPIHCAWAPSCLWELLSTGSPSPPSPRGTLVIIPMGQLPCPISSQHLFPEQQPLLPSGSRCLSGYISTICPKENLQSPFPLLPKHIPAQVLHREF